MLHQRFFHHILSGQILTFAALNEYGRTVDERSFYSRKEFHLDYLSSLFYTDSLTLTALPKQPLSRGGRGHTVYRYVLFKMRP